MVGFSIIYKSFPANIYNLQNIASVNLNVKCILSVDTSTKRLVKQKRSQCQSVIQFLEFQPLSASYVEEQTLQCFCKDFYNPKHIHVHVCVAVCTDMYA